MRDELVFWLIMGLISCGVLWIGHWDYKQTLVFNAKKEAAHSFCQTVCEPNDGSQGEGPKQCICDLNKIVVNSK